MAFTSWLRSVPSQATTKEDLSQDWVGLKSSLMMPWNTCPALQRKKISSRFASRVAKNRMHSGPQLRRRRRVQRLPGWVSNPGRPDTTSLSHCPTLSEAHAASLLTKLQQELVTGQEAGTHSPCWAVGRTSRRSPPLGRWRASLGWAPCHRFQGRAVCFDGRGPPPPLR